MPVYTFFSHFNGVLAVEKLLFKKKMPNLGLTLLRSLTLLSPSMFPQAQQIVLSFLYLTYIYKFTLSLPMHQGFSLSLLGIT